MGCELGEAGVHGAVACLSTSISHITLEGGGAGMGMKFQGPHPSIPHALSVCMGVLRGRRDVEGVGGITEGPSRRMHYSRLSAILGLGEEKLEVSIEKRRETRDFNRKAKGSGDRNE